ncbi:type III-B CRISPR module-associated Cmr3 family protein [Clostridium sp. Marseille-Q2269]|uniref:type III-B CRISPR module-associated Cmr3 family protein n=1 Tax=Clostridium sp. Marseille-Q2269 TaxID=2942205 RepID=UPI0020732452|nr:type III-B CRISPR module-associated Cmr3 family protein [Clostridium sp. Marseille-Q2269]
MNRYLVKLKPADSFFFGGEKGFGFNDGKGSLENNIVKSREFPQQTSILGMIRKELLVLHGYLKEKWDYYDHEKKKNHKLVGKESFSIAGENQDFGIVNGISPVFIIEETKGSDKFLIRIPKDHNLNNNSDKYNPLRFNDDKDNCLKVKTNFAEEVYLPIDFDAKKGLSEDFIDIETGHIVDKNKVFIKDCSIGIRLDKNHKTEANSLFRLEKYKFSYDSKYGRADKCFAFILDVEEEEFTFENHKNIITLGGEGSHFFISFEKVNFNIKDKIRFIDKEKNGFTIKERISLPNNEKEIKKAKQVYKIILLSDTYISKDIYEKNCSYAISTKIDFKSLCSDNYCKNKNKHYYNRFDRSESKYSLLEKGSVLFAAKDNYDKLIENINNSKFQKIGYNIFI